MLMWYTSIHRPIFFRVENDERRTASDNDGEIRALKEDRHIVEAFVQAWKTGETQSPDKLVYVPEVA